MIQNQRLSFKQDADAIMTEYKYSQIENQSDKNVKKTWMEYQVRLPIVLIALLLQSLFIGAAMFLIVLQQKTPTPIEKSLHDSAGNYYPAAEAVKYKSLVFEYNSTFMTMEDVPTAETDAAWQDMQEPTDGMIQASYETGFDIDSLPKTNQSLVDSRQYMYGLEVHHQLHCLDMIRKSFYPKHYFPKKSDHQVAFHREHCLEHLRHSIMCSGDFSLDYWEYDEETHKRWLKSDVPHVCRDFTALSDWVVENQYRPESWQPLEN